MSPGILMVGLFASVTAAAAPTRLVVGVATTSLWRTEARKQVDELLRAAGGVEVRRLERALVFDTNESSLRVIDALRRRPDVRWIEREVYFPVRWRAVPDDPRYPEQWTLHSVSDPDIAADANIGAEAAWDSTRGTSAAGIPVRIAVVDDGFDLGHPDLQFAAGYDVSSNDGVSGYDDDPSYGPGDYHGTHTAGVAAAIGFNGVGLSGVCPACVIVPVRLIGNGGPADLYSSGSAVAAAIEWAAFSGVADVINNSWGPPDGNALNPGHDVQLWPRPTANRPGGVLPAVITEALEHAVRDGRGGRGAVITWSAGNGNEMVTYDGFASSPEVLAIGSIDAGGRRAYYSDFGPPIFLVAPSDGGFSDPAVLTTDIAGAAGSSADDTFDRFGGTSAAAAMVAGVAALVLADYPNLTAAQVAESLALGAVRVDERFGEYDGGRSPFYGFGRVDAAGALTQAALYGDACTFSLELCGNDRDDNCDGRIDEATWCAHCVPDVDGGEICDGRDNDCDGAVNEDFVCEPEDRPVCAPCSDSSECVFGSRCRATVAFPGTYCFADCIGGSCPGGFVCDGDICVPAAPVAPGDPEDCHDYLVASCAIPEACDGIDSDCNGVVDDLDPAGRETLIARRRCQGVGVCADAGAECVNAAWRCIPAPAYSATEICCDHLDNDCNGVADDGCAIYGVAGGGCGRLDRGPCQPSAPSAGATGGWAAVILVLGWLRRRRRIEGLTCTTET